MTHPRTAKVIQNQEIAHAPATSHISRQLSAGSAPSDGSDSSDGSDL
ncbi:MAG: hypothetical protein PUI89_00630 [Bacteroidales bacterium]|nr:hypothetical protein [Bacteroidales bacterium]